MTQYLFLVNDCVDTENFERKLGEVAKERGEVSLNVRWCGNLLNELEVFW